MSHFSCLVITSGTAPMTEDQLEPILAPWHEYECTGTNDQYVVDVDATEESLNYGRNEDGSIDLAKALSWHGLEEAVVESEDQIERDGAHKYGYAVVKDGQLIKAVNRTNPNKHWDWWVIGGRWTGSLKMKDGTVIVTGRPGLMTPPPRQGFADTAVLKDIDLDGMRADAEQEARNFHAKVQAAIAGTPELEISIAAYREAKDFSQATKDAFFGQPRLKALNEAFPNTFYTLDLYDRAALPLETLIEQARGAAIGAYAVVKDGEWYERGQMGWWGISHNEKDTDDWNAELAKLLDGLDPEATVLTMVDCHI